MSRYRFGPFELDEAEHSLLADGRPVPLAGRAFDTLLALVRRPGRLVTRDELIAAVWGETIVEEGNLHWTISAVRKVLAQESATPVIETVRGVGYRFVAPVEVLAEASGGGGGLEPPLASSLPFRRRRILAVGLAVLLLAALAWTVAGRRRAAGSSDGSGVAVVGFRNLSPQREAGWIGTALSEMLAADLGGSGSLRLVPSDDVAGMRRDLGLRLDGPMGLGELRQVRRRLGSDWVVVGSYLLLPGQDPPLRVDVLLRHTGTGETRTSLSRRGREKDLFALADSLAGDLRRALAQLAGGGTGAQAQRLAMPASLQAQRLYAEGLERLRRREALAAAQRLQEAVAAEPAFYGSWLALAQADDLLGFESKASEAALQAMARSASLPERQRLTVEAMYDAIARRRPEAVERRRRLYELSRHGFDEGLALVQTEVRAGQGREAVGLIAELRREHPISRDDARLALYEAAATGILEDYPRALLAAGRAVAAARRQGMAVVEIEALHRLAVDRLRAGTTADCGRSLADVTDARRKAAALGDRFLLAGVLQDLSIALSRCGQEARADEILRQSIALNREVGAEGKVPPLLYNLANSRLGAGDLFEADRLMREALETCQSSGILCGERYLHPLGANRLHRGELAEARRMIEESIRLNTARGNRNRVAEAEGFLPDLAFWSGDVSRAVELQRRVLSLRQEMEVPNAIAWAHSDLAGWLAEAGRDAEALAQAREAVAMAEQDGGSTLRACSRASLAAAELALHDLEAADRDSAVAIALAPLPREPFCSFIVWRVRSAVLLASGQLDAAGGLIEQGLDLARRNGFVTYELWARLLRARLALARGHASEARRLAVELAAEARAKSLGGVAQGCAALLADPRRETEKTEAEERGKGD